MTSESKELRDAVIMDIGQTPNTCRVKIQGTDQLITAYYNENWEATPQWLKAGNAVRITTPGGNKGRIEVAGHGFVLPTAVAGGNVTPTPTTPGDTILSGLDMTANGTGLYASVSIGTYRIDGVIYTLGAMTMNIAAIVMNRSDLIMGGSAGSVTFDSISSTQYRIDVVSVGVAGTLTVTKGTPSTGEPTQPDTPTDEVLIGWVLFYPGLTVIAQKDVNAQWGSSKVSALTLTDTVNDFDIPWSTETTNIAVKIVDQYGNLVSGTYFVTIAFTSTEIGNGTLSYGSQSITSGSMVITFNGSMTILYTRYGQPPGESVDASSPTFTFNESSTLVANAVTVYCLDAAGDPMF